MREETERLLALGVREQIEELAHYFSGIGDQLIRLSRSTDNLGQPESAISPKPLTGVALAGKVLSAIERQRPGLPRLLIAAADYDAFVSATALIKERSGDEDRG